MTDAQIIELLGWPAHRPDVHPNGLFMKIRAVVAAAQAEQDAKIEAMRAALVEARTHIAIDRESFVQCATAPHQPLDADAQGIVDEYDGLLRMIDEAMGKQA
ncbi:hypothetical protein [Thiohalocapsa marina]|uniref:hypothetical protein n=1 Tax=Thiohalocapsa marina TaxID=424902 RepID=UPI0036DB744C